MVCLQRFILVIYISKWNIKTSCLAISWKTNPLDCWIPDHLNVQMLSPYYRSTHCGGRTKLPTSYLDNWVSNNDKEISSYLNGPRNRVVGQNQWQWVFETNSHLADANNFSNTCAPKIGSFVENWFQYVCLRNVRYFIRYSVINQRNMFNILLAYSTKVHHVRKRDNCFDTTNYITYFELSLRWFVVIFQRALHVFDSDICFGHFGMTGSGWKTLLISMNDESHGINYVCS